MAPMSSMPRLHPGFKILTTLLLGYTVIAGLMGPVPRLPILEETIRNTHFHIPLWFGMILILTYALILAIRYLRKPTAALDLRIRDLTYVGVLFGVLGLLTGSLWARYTWGEWWSSDPKQNAAAIGLLVYAGYFALRSAYEDGEQRGRVSAIMNIMAYAVLIPILFILPRLTDSLHPGNGGNPAFSSYDMNSDLRMVFYPAIVGWFLLGLWMAELKWRISLLAAFSHNTN
jgi:heme exporter protein C